MNQMVQVRLDLQLIAAKNEIMGLMNELINTKAALHQVQEELDILKKALSSQATQAAQAAQVEK